MYFFIFVLHEYTLYINGFPNYTASYLITFLLWHYKVIIHMVHCSNVSIYFGNIIVLKLLISAHNHAEVSLLYVIDACLTEHQLIPIITHLNDNQRQTTWMLHKLHGTTHISNAIIQDTVCIKVPSSSPGHVL